MALTVRAGEFKDAAGIAVVHVQSWNTTYRGIVPDDYLASLNIESRTERWESQLLSSDSSIFVAEDESGIFGFVTGGRLREDIDEFDAELYAIYLLHSRQRQGVGRRLTQALAGSLRAQGLKRMVVWVLEENPSVGFYEKLGGVQIAQKQTEIGGASLSEVAFGWRSIDQLVPMQGDSQVRTIG